MKRKLKKLLSLSKPKSKFGLAAVKRRAKAGSCTTKSTGTRKKWCRTPECEQLEKILFLSDKISSVTHLRLARMARDIADHIVSLSELQLWNPYVTSIQKRIRNIIYSFSIVDCLKLSGKREYGLGGLPPWVRRIVKASKRPPQWSREAVKQHRQAQ